MASHFCRLEYIRSVFGEMFVLVFAIDHLYIPTAGYSVYRSVAGNHDLDLSTDISAYEHVRMIFWLLGSVVLKLR